VIFEVTTQLALILLLACASPLQALATNKVQRSFGAATAAFTDARAPFSLVAIAVWDLFGVVSSRIMHKRCLIRWYQHLTVIVDPMNADLR
jgi:hypothetical protein